MEEKIIILPEGREIDKVEVIKYILKDSNKNPPKTWEECYTLLGRGEFITSDLCYNIRQIDKSWQL